jgi:ribosomal protein L29
MKAAELRDLAADELGAKERELTDQLFPERIKTGRRDLARVKTFLRMKRAG